MVELAVVIAIIGVLAAIGMYSGRQQIAQYRLMSAARLLQSDIQGLRATAISTNRQTRLLLIEADAAMDPQEAQIGAWLLQVGDRSSGSTEWDTLPIDKEVPDSSLGERSLNVDGLNERPGISLMPWPSLAGPGLGNTDAVVFSPRGFVDNPVSDFVGGYITLSLANKRFAGGDEVSLVSIVISRGGLAHMETSAGTALASGDVGSEGATTP